MSAQAYSVSGQTEGKKGGLFSMKNHILIL